MIKFSNLKMLNYYLFFCIFNFFKKYKHYTNFFIFFSKYSSVLFCFIYFLAIFYIIFNFKQNISIINLIFAPCLTLLINMLIRKTFKVKRPEQFLKIKPLIYHTKNSSFPSNHSAMAMCIALCTIRILPDFTIILLFITFLTGISRVIVGVHYPFDILAGFFIGYFVTYVLQILL